MKSIFNKQAGQRLAGLSALLCLSGLIFVPFAAGAAQATWDSINYGSYFSTPPVIDATNFINRGTWSISVGPYPYRTSDTLNYTNRGVMDSSIGWAFDLGPASSGSSLTMRNAAGSFFNANNGVIEADDAATVASIYGVKYASYLWVSATNIVNQPGGTLEAGGSGQILLIGTNVNLSRSLVEIIPTTPSSSGSSPYLVTATNIVPAKGFIYDYWGQTNVNVGTSNLWDGLHFSVPSYTVNAPCNETNILSPWSFAANPNYTFYTNHQGGFLVTTNIGGGPYYTGVATNYYYEVVFIIPPSSANFGGDVRFTSTQNPTNAFDTVAVQLAQTITNLVTLQLQTSTFYLVDVMASETNGGLFLAPPNPISGCSDVSRQPENYVVSRTDPYLPDVYFPYYNLGTGYAFASGLPGITGLPTNNFLYNSTWSNSVINIKYSALDTTINNVTTPGGTLQTSGGRVQIYAGNLNLGLTRMSGEAWVDVHGGHLVDSVGAVVDCPNLSFDLGSTNGTLIFTNLALSTVNRFQGNVVAWSATWSNLFSVLAPSYFYDAATSNIDLLGFVTNAAQANLYVMVVDASQLGLPIPVSVVDLHLHATNGGGGIVIGDSVIVTNSFFMDGTGLTIQQSVALANGVQSWIWTNAPTLRYFTNNGSLTVPNSAHFGDDGPTNYMAFLNYGSISAGGLMINSSTFENDGVLNSGMGCYVTTLSGKFQNGQINSGSDIQFSANTLKFNQSSLQASGGELDFTVANSLADAGPNSGNTFTCDYGFNLWTKPQLGDLLGTIMTTVAPNIFSIEIDHSWAGTNYGPSNAGYSNNVALGRLVLAPQGSVVTRPPTFFFAGATGGGVTNGLYVDLLDLTALGNNWTNIQQNLLEIDPSLVIYYAAAKVGFTPPPSAPGMPPQEPEEFLNGQFGGHLRWVQTFAGPNSSVAVDINGASYLVNKALRFATTIKSNGTNWNYASLFPFTNPPPGSIPQLVLKASLLPQTGQLLPLIGGTQPNQSSPSVLALSWLAVANTVYNIQFTTNLAPANWQPLLTYTNNAPTNQTVTIFDTNAPTIASKRFYRVSYGP